jgi:hypothetical protein
MHRNTGKSYPSFAESEEVSNGGVGISEGARAEGIRTELVCLYNKYTVANIMM